MEDSEILLRDGAGEAQSPHNSPWVGRPEGKDKQFDAYWRLGCPSVGDAIEAFFPGFGCWRPAKFDHVTPDGSFCILWKSDNTKSFLPEDSVRRLGEEKLDPADPELDGRGDGTSSELMRLLRLARPKWRDKDVYAAADKLRSIGIVEVAELHESIESELEGDDSGVNRRLLRSGQRTFAEATLYALRFNPKANRGEVPQVPPVFSERRPRRRGRMSDAHANGEQRSEQVPALGPFRPKSQPVTHRVRPRAPRRARRRYDLSSDEEEEDDEEEHEQEEDEEEDEEEDDEEAESDFSVPDADAVWIASEDTVYGPTYATEHHAPRARASPTQGCHGTSSDSGGEDHARSGREFPSLVRPAPGHAPVERAREGRHWHRLGLPTREE